VPYYGQRLDRSINVRKASEKTMTKCEVKTKKRNGGGGGSTVKEYKEEHSSSAPANEIEHQGEAGDQEPVQAAEFMPVWTKGANIKGGSKKRETWGHGRMHGHA
jgi:hypothetical protein